MSYSVPHLSLLPQPIDEVEQWFQPLEEYEPYADAYYEQPAQPQDVDIFAVEGWDATEGGTWRQAALCAETDPEAFFPDKGGSTREAKQVCRGCPVRGECLEYALENEERFGIWGGLSERERRRLRTQRRMLLSA